MNASKEKCREADAYTIKTNKSGNSGKVVRSGKAIQVSEAEYERIVEAVGQAGSVEFNGEVRQIEGFGDTFKLNKVLHRYVYLASPLKVTATAQVGDDQTELRNAIL